MKTNDVTNQLPAQSLSSALEAIPEDLIVRALSEALTATTTTRAGTVEPDTRSRLAAAQMILDRVLGKPIERQQVITAKVESEGETELIARLAHSPALRSVLREVLAKAERG